MSGDATEGLRGIRHPFVLLLLCFGAGAAPGDENFRAVVLHIPSPSPAGASDPADEVAGGLTTPSCVSGGDANIAARDGPAPSSAAKR
jgi:hypothetical protein